MALAIHLAVSEIADITDHGLTGSFLSFGEHFVFEPKTENL